MKEMDLLVSDQLAHFVVVFALFLSQVVRTVLIVSLKQSCLLECLLIVFFFFFGGGGGIHLKLLFCLIVHVLFAHLLVHLNSFVFISLLI